MRFGQLNKVSLKLEYEGKLPRFYHAVNQGPDAEYPEAD